MTTSKFIPAKAFHPGVTLAEKLKEIGMSIKEFAIRTTKPEKTIYAVINGESSVTSDMAIAFENITRIPAHFWLNKQRNYDEFLARLRQERIIDEACEWAKRFPYAQMVKLGWIESSRTQHEKAKSLFSFFQINTRKAWEDFYLKKKLKVAFRISLSHAKDPYALSAWLRQGEIQAAEISTAIYSEVKLRNLIPDLKRIMTEEPPTFAIKAQELCAGAGVKLVYTPCISKAPVGGSTRWINGIPCIQISGRHKKYDIFWFTLFHEIGHLLLHGKKDIFLEGEQLTAEELGKENEANRFASNILLSAVEEKEIIANNDFSSETIRQFARQFNTHPAVIVGRLHHLGIIPYNRHNDMLVSINLFDK